MSARTRVLTGITTTGTPHLGNYVGAIRPALRMAQAVDVDAFFFLADYHALIKCDDPERIARSRLEIAATWLACGLDWQRVTFYRQSDIPEIPELTWLLTCVTAKGLMNRAHAYKAAVDANAAQGEDADAGVTLGLYSYPVLMAADILMFGAQRVPVGRDQVQHIEMARDIAQRFNHLYGAGKDLLTLPAAVVDEDVATLPGLDGRKMSKSYDNTIPLFAGGPRALEDAIARIVTDSRRPGEPKDPDSNALCAIYRAFATRAQGDAYAADLRAGLAWGEAKQRLATQIEDEIGPMRARYDRLTVESNQIEEILQEGAAKARTLAAPLLARLRQAIGLRAPQAGSAQVMRRNDSARVGRFVTFRGKDGHFHFRFLGADGADLLLSVPFDTPKAAADWIQVLDKAGGAASFVWGPDNLHLRAAEHVGGHAFELWFAHERLAEAGPYAEAAARDVAMLHLVDALEARWHALLAAQS
ncbi:tryptophan--tRNA ligase [Metallibacterium scheffleri]|uniref:Tryptophan--tRNA ligase n=1 Tax=Metallibacterium scheffleri TaxID=993689 RepID=A0A4S3KSP5_9GAMM|nr:tryptophan--tRNA ligase [Metallibacterium scheffleri]THD12145.1 tryptophan--tRNA ligase [Metallibacterium scheffleri]